MQTFGDLLLIASIIIALIVVPPYLWRVYGGADAVKRLWAWHMSSAAYAPTPIDRPSLEDDAETDARQTPIVLPERKIRAEELLTLYALMRRYNIPREAAAAAFKAVDLPFNNNVWSKAAPEEEMQVTPIAGRPTPAKFDHDPALAYEPPPR